MAVGSGQIPTLPAPPPPPCDLAAWLATLDPSLGAGATTYDVCKSRCPHAKDESAMVPPFFSGVVDLYPGGSPRLGVAGHRGVPRRDGLLSLAASQP